MDGRIREMIDRNKFPVPVDYEGIDIVDVVPVYVVEKVLGMIEEHSAQKAASGLVECHNCGRLYDPLDSEADKNDMFCCVACEYGF